MPHLAPSRPSRPAAPRLALGSCSPPSPLAPHGRAAALAPPPPHATGDERLDRPLLVLRHVQPGAGQRGRAGGEAGVCSQLPR